MAKVKFTKNELKSQKDNLSRFNRYLPTLILKKQQLQLEIRKVEQQMEERKTARLTVVDDVMSWVAVFGEDVGFAQLIKVQALRSESGNIAGIDIPIFLGLDFGVVEYSLFAMPLWVDAAVNRVQEILALDAELAMLAEQVGRLGEELRITTQRVNLFEKVKIPEAKDNIRMIQIYLGDQQTAAVVRGKIAKNKLVKVS